jgi:hypothetical protein
LFPNFFQAGTSLALVSGDNNEETQAMKRTSLMTAALFALLLVPALQAQYGGNGHVDPYGNRHPSRDGNFYPDSAHMDRVSVLAHDIDNTARYIYKMARRNNRRPDQYEAQMLRDLYTLYGQAAHFHAEAESFGQDPEHTADDFSALEEAFYQLGNTTAACSGSTTR